MNYFNALFIINCTCSHMQGEEGPQQMLKNLQLALVKDDVATILQLVAQLQKENPQDIEYKQCYAIAAIKSKSFAQLASGIFKEQPTNKDLLKIYYYYLYASGQYQKCIEALEGTKESSLQLLLAQAHFKNMEYQKSTSIMAQLLRTVKMTLEDKETYMINLLASSEPETKKEVEEFKFLITEQSCKEMFYNYSLFLFELGDVEKGLHYLGLFESALDKSDEVDWITVKLLRDYLKFKVHRAGQLASVQKIQEYNSMLKNTNDSNLRSVISNNSLFLNSHLEGLTDSYKHIEEFFGPNYKLSETQTVILKINRLSLLLRKNRVNESAKNIKQIEHIKSPQKLLRNYEFVRDKYYALKKNKEYEAARALVGEVFGFDQNFGFCLLADLAMELNERKTILETLRSIAKGGSEYIKNFIFSLLIRDETLFEQYSEYLEELIKNSEEFEILEVLLKLYENKQDVDKQKLVLNRMLQVNSKSSFARVKLAEHYLSEQLLDKAEELLKGVETPEEITDLNYLQYIEKNIHVSKKENEKVTEDSKKIPNKKRIKKKKRVRLPKNLGKFVEGFKPDPERWLPKWQRKGYKKKGKKGGNKTQGLSSVGSEQKNTYSVGASTSTKEVTKEHKKRR